MISKVKIQDLFSERERFDKRAYIIAEIGINHEGSVDHCAEMIRKFAKAGADAIKLQTVDADRSYAPDTDSHKVFSRATISREETANMFSLARKCGVEVFSTSGDLYSLEWIDRLNPNAHKISSGLLSCTPIVEAACSLQKPVIVSTGMSNGQETEEAITKATQIAKQVALMQCTSLYPCPPELLNLTVIQALEMKYSLPVGFSDHSLGISMAPLAVAAGAKLIEKHVTYDKKRSGFDHCISLEYQEFEAMVGQIRLAELALGRPDKLEQKNKSEEMVKNERRLAAIIDLQVGQTLDISDFLFMRFPMGSNGILARDTDKVIGRELRNPISARSEITWEDLK